VEYERIARHGAPAPLTIHLSPAAASAGLARIWIDRRFLDGFDVERILPEPRDVSADGERLVFTFAVGPAASITAIRFDLQANALWLREGAIGSIDGPSVRFSQLVLP
jgi:hypothetical protein